MGVVGGSGHDVDKIEDRCAALTHRLGVTAHEPGRFCRNHSPTVQHYNRICTASIEHE